MPLYGIGEDELGAVRLQQRPPLLRHRGGHREDHPVAARGADERERDAGVAARRLDDGAAGLQLARRLGGVDERDAQPVLDARARVVELELGEDLPAESFGDRVEPDQRVLPNAEVMSEWIPGTGRLSVEECSTSILSQVLVQRGRQVALAERRDDHDDVLAGGLGARGDLQRGPDGRTRRDADEDAVLRADVARGRDRVGELDVDDLVDDAAGRGSRG